MCVCVCARTRTSDKANRRICARAAFEILILQNAIALALPLSLSLSHTRASLSRSFVNFNSAAIDDGRKGERDRERKVLARGEMYGDRAREISFGNFQHEDSRSPYL